MPSTYAHYKFGTEVRERLPESIRRSVEVAPELFLIGQHGPDILFYYNALKPNPVNQKGSGMHARPAAEFFEPALDVIRNLDEDRGEKAYLYGFVCHFMLDSCAHWYVDERIEESGVSHTEIEGEFDRMLMERDGLDPVSYRPTAHIIPSGRNAHVIAEFFPEFTEKKIKKSLRDMRTCSNILVCPGVLKRAVIMGAITVLGMKNSVGGMVINREPNPKCMESNERLMRLFEKALDEAVKYLAEFEAAAETNTPLSARFFRTFGPDEASREEYEIY